MVMRLISVISWFLAIANVVLFAKTANPLATSFDVSFLHAVSGAVGIVYGVLSLRQIIAKEKQFENKS